MEATNSALADKDGEILRLLNQIASDMIRREDVDQMIAKAVEDAVSEVTAQYERKMTDMAAEHEAKIVALEKKNKEGKGGSSTPRKKSGTQVFDTKEELPFLGK